MHRPVADPAASQWHLDRRIPVLTLVALLIQTAAIIWWAATITSTVESQGKTLMEVKEYGSPITRDRLTILEQKVNEFDQRFSTTNAAIDRLSNKIDILILSKQPDGGKRP